MTFDDIPIDPANRKFEARGDVLRWILHSLWAYLQLPWWRKAPFPQHQGDSFNYKLAGGTQRVAIFGDFGTGLYYSRYIARHIEALAPAYAFHLGDVYYAGTRKEFARHFDGVLAPLLKNTRLFALNGNHEMMSGGRPYFQYLKEKRARDGVVQQEQEGSYFCIESEHIQFIGIDTDYHRRGRLGGGQGEWLREQLTRGRALGRKNILFSQSQPYSLGPDSQTPLYTTDIGPETAQLIDFWFWGNSHHASLHDKTSDFPFVGSCVGHSGHPFDRKRREDGARSPAPVRWLEDGPRFPPETGLRQDQGNPGFLILELQDGGRQIDFKYYDWRGELRFEFTP